MDFAPSADVVGMYSCGPTVYHFAHLGNMRAYVFADTLRRALRWKAIPVRQVVNITDVGHAVADSDTGEDKIEMAAAREERSVEEIAAFYTKAFFDDMAALNVLPADVYPRATEYVPEMIEFAARLEELGYTYLLPSGLYFDTSKSPGYGTLALLDLEGQREGARVEQVEGRMNKSDFALWRAEEPGVRRVMRWKSPWGWGAPGWHLECSVMSMALLGAAFRHPHRRRRPPRAAPRQRDRAERGVPRRRAAVGAVLGAQRVPAAEQREDRQVIGTRAAARRPRRGRLPPDGLPAVPARRPLPQPARLHHERGRRRAGDAAPPGRARRAAPPAARGRDLRRGACAAAARGDKVAARRTWSNRRGDRRRPGDSEDPRHPPGVAARHRTSAPRGCASWSRPPTRCSASASPTSTVREVDRRRSAADLDPAEVETIERKIADRTQARKDRNWGRADEIRAELEALGVQVTDTPAGPTWELT